MWETTNMRKKNPRFNCFAPIVCGVLGVPPPPNTSGFLIVNIQHVEYLWFVIGAPLTFFQADSVTLNTPHTTGKSDKIIFRTTKIIGTLPRIVGRGEIGPKSAWLSCGVYLVLGDELTVFVFAGSRWIPRWGSLLRKTEEDRRRISDR